MKKLIGLLVVFSIVCGIPAFAFASDDIKPSSFSDVSSDAWYSQAVDYMEQHGIISGYDNGKFGADDVMNRAQWATVLWRYNDPEQVATYNQATAINETGLPDVQNGEWYTGAANWAVANGVISGVETETGRQFQPNAPLTFEQMVVILANSLKDQPSSVDTSRLDQYKDASQVSDWARYSMAWFVNEGWVGGTNGQLLPKDPVTRARAATVFYRVITGDTVEGEIPPQVDILYENSYYSIALPEAWKGRNVEVLFPEVANPDKLITKPLGIGEMVDIVVDGNYVFTVACFTNDWGPQGEFQFVKVGSVSWAPDVNVLVIDGGYDYLMDGAAEQAAQLVKAAAQYVTVK